MKLLFTKGPSLAIRGLLFALLAIALMALDHQGRFGAARFFLAELVLPIQQIINLPVKWAGWLSTSFATHQALLNENATLRAEHIILQARLQRLMALESENAELRALLKSSPAIGNGKVRVAQLLAIDSDPFIQQVLLNVGGREGVYIGQPVLDATGIVGQVIQRGYATSEVMLITDTRSAVPVQVSRNGLRAIVVGTGNANKLKLSHISDTMDVRPGDELASSGLGQRYPAGYPVGVIDSVVHSAGEQFATITVTPAAKLSRSRQVLLFWPENNATAAERKQLRASVKEDKVEKTTNSGKTNLAPGTKPHAH